MKYEGYSAELHVASSNDLRHWTKSPSSLPTHDCALTTYHSQLVLVGGVDATTGQDTNKLWMSYNRGHNWKPSLPPMPTPHRNPLAVNTVNPECLMVANNSGLSQKKTIYILIGKHWVTIEHPEKSALYYGITLHNGRLYFNYPGTIYHCDVKLLIASCTQPRSDQPPNSASLWSEIASPGLCRLASFGQQLIAFYDYFKGIQAYSPFTQSWMHICKAVPGVRKSVYGSVLLPTGDLVVFVNANRIFRAKIEVFQAILRGEINNVPACISH